MTAALHERLSAQDRSFLVFEEPSHPMHLGALALFEGGSLVDPRGRADLARLRAHVRSRMHAAPRYRQRLAWVPLLGRPVWVDDAAFDLRRHVRRVTLTPPGDEAQLRRVIALALEKPLDRAHPLWELLLVDGLGEGRFALLVKTHHAVADGISALGLFAALLSGEPSKGVERAPAWRARPAPAPLELLGLEAWHASLSLAALTARAAQALAEPSRLRESFAPGLRAVVGLLRLAARPPAATPHNRPLGPKRRFEWLRLDLAEVRQVKERRGGTLNDVVLASVAGGVRRFLERRGVDPRGLEYRVVVPVSLRASQEQGLARNRVSAWLAPLPLDEPDALRRHARVQATTRRMKEGQLALGPGLLAEAAELAPPGALELGVRLTARLHPYNLIVSNVAGPPLPLWLLDARLHAAYPQVPLFAHQGLGLALLSYDGALCWGFNADPEAMPDLPDFVADVERSFRELHARSA